MAKQRTHSQHLISIGGIGLAGLWLSVAACRLTHLCCLIARAALEALPSIILVAWQTAQALAFGHPRIVECLCQCASIFPLVVSLARFI